MPLPQKLSVTDVSRENGANDATRDITKETQIARMDLENALHLCKLKKRILHHKESPFFFTYLIGYDVKSRTASWAT